MLRSYREMRLNNVLSKGKAKMLCSEKRMKNPGESITKICSVALASTLFCFVLGGADISAHAQTESNNAPAVDGDTGRSGGDRDNGTDGDGDRSSSGDGDRGSGGDGDGDRPSGGGGDGDRPSGGGGDDGDSVRGTRGGSNTTASNNNAAEDSCRNSIATYGNSDVLRQSCNGPFYR